jgi:hypothetical protein
LQISREDGGRLSSGKYAKKNIKLSILTNCSGVLWKILRVTKKIGKICEIFLASKEKILFGPQMKNLVWSPKKNFYIARLKLLGIFLIFKLLNF